MNAQIFEQVQNKGNYFLQFEPKGSVKSNCGLVLKNVLGYKNVFK